MVEPPLRWDDLKLLWIIPELSRVHWFKAHTHTYNILIYIYIYTPVCLLIKLYGTLLSYIVYDVYIISINIYYGTSIT